MQSDAESTTRTEQEVSNSPNRHGVEYSDIEVGDTVRLYSAHTESVVTGTVRDKEAEESNITGKVYAEITVDIDPRHLHSGTVSAEEWAEMGQIREVLG